MASWVACFPAEVFEMCSKTQHKYLKKTEIQNHTDILMLIISVSCSQTFSLPYLHIQNEHHHQSAHILEDEMNYH